MKIRKGARMFTRYFTEASVSAGDELVHPQYGFGIILEVNGDQALIFFEDGGERLISLDSN